MRISPDIVMYWMNFALIVWAVMKMTKEAGSAINRPEVLQNERITKLEVWRDEVNRKLDIDNKRVNVLEEGNRVTARSLIAIINSLKSVVPTDSREELSKAEKDLNEYLIEK